jgi:hypothetical protein
MATAIQTFLFSVAIATGQGTQLNYCCDGCQCPIKAGDDILHCLSCADFDLCVACHRQHINTRQPEHDKSHRFRAYKLPSSGMNLPFAVYQEAVTTLASGTTMADNTMDPLVDSLLGSMQQPPLSSSLNKSTHEGKLSLNYASTIIAQRIYRFVSFFAAWHMPAVSSIMNLRDAAACLQNGGWTSPQRSREWVHAILNPAVAMAGAFQLQENREAFAGLMDS